MLLYPRNSAEKQHGRDFLAARGVFVSQDAHLLYWVLDGKTTWVVGFDGWVGDTCQLHVASSGTRLVPRLFVRCVFQYAFGVLRRKAIFGIVNSHNKPAMRLDKWLGFQESIRYCGVGGEDGDLVVMTMYPAQCRWLKEPHGKVYSAAP